MAFGLLELWGSSSHAGEDGGSQTQRSEKQHWDYLVPRVLRHEIAHLAVRSVAEASPRCVPLTHLQLGRCTFTPQTGKRLWFTCTPRPNTSWQGSRMPLSGDHSQRLYPHWLLKTLGIVMIFAGFLSFSF